jgi:serine/threonine-protein kinase
MSERPCLDETDLLPLTAGETADPAVREHLDQCPTCRERLKQLQGEVSSLRRVVGEGTGLSSLMPPVLGDRAEAGAGEASAATAPVSRSSRRPASVGKYFIAGLLDEMETTYTYRALHPTLHKELVVKLGRQATGQDPARHQALVEEGKRLAQIEHRNLVRVHDLNFHKNRPYLVMEHVHGTNLKNHAAEAWPTPVQVARLIAKVARGLAEVHRRGLVHQDIRPSNILIDEAGEPRLAFGLASLHQQRPDLDPTPASSLLTYMAPEQARGEKEQITPRSDIFGLGCVLYYLLARKPPFEGKDPFDSLKRALNVDFDQEALRARQVPGRLEAICAKAMAPKPTDRYPSADAFADDLERFVRRPHGMSGGLIVTIVAVLVLVAGGVAFWLFQGD